MAVDWKDSLRLIKNDMKTTNRKVPALCPAGQTHIEVVIDYNKVKIPEVQDQKAIKLTPTTTGKIVELLS